MCRAMCITPVHAQIGCTQDIRPMDLAIRAYVTLVFSPGHFVVNLDDFMISVKQYPTNSPVPSPWSYTIFLSNDVGDFLDLSARRVLMA